ncbi:MAG: DUF971 domain-containing protein [Planctomycetota bacterium]|nr:MAG: DUF971 domain-containing protein [Planctomycetota bacterium]
MNPPQFSSPQIVPQSIERLSPTRIAVVWSDGMRTTYEANRLREACPCATCREKRQAKESPGQSLALPVLSKAEAQPVAIQRMTPVGNYAYNIAFSDGHDSGIYVFEYLYGLGETDPADLPTTGSPTSTSSGGAV